MKIGDYVKLPESYGYAYNLLPDLGSVNHSYPPFEPGEVGVIIDSGTRIIQDKRFTYNKIRAPKGIGWIPSHFLEEVIILKSGDLVVLDPERGAHSITIYSSWGDQSTYLVIDHGIGRFYVGELALILEEKNTFHGSGCRILTRVGRIGWVSSNYLRKVSQVIP